MNLEVTNHLQTSPSGRPLRRISRSLSSNAPGPWEKVGIDKNYATESSGVTSRSIGIEALVETGKSIQQKSLRKQIRHPLVETTAMPNNRKPEPHILRSSCCTLSRANIHSCCSRTYTSLIMAVDGSWLVSRGSGFMMWIANKFLAPGSI